MMNVLKREDSMELRDRIRIQGMTGVVVALISDGKFAESHPADQWAHLKHGALILTDEAGLIHYPSLDGIDVEKISDK
jgi:hypothetical protein